MRTLIPSLAAGERTAGGALSSAANGIKESTAAFTGMVYREWQERSSGRRAFES